jgi:integrase
VNSVARQVTGQIYTRRSGGDLVYMLRFRAAGYPSRPIELGRMSHGCDMTKAHAQRDLVIALIRSGRWSAPQKPEKPPRKVGSTTFANACAQYVEKRRRTIATSTLNDLVTKLRVHLLPGIGPTLPITEIDADAISAYIDALLEHNERIHEAEERGEPLRRPPTELELQRSGGERWLTPQQRPISGGQINKHVELLKQILEPYVGGELDSNPVVVGDHHIQYSSKTNWKLQPDEIVSLLNASASLDVAIVQLKSRRLRGACVSLRRDGLTYEQIASKLGIVEGTVGYHLRLGHVAAPVTPMYRALIHVLLIAGLRISEALALRCEDIDLFHLNIYVEVSKTAAGRRHVHIHEPLAEVLLEYEEARGSTWTQGALAFCTRNGTPLSRNNVARRTMPRLKEEANEQRKRQGHGPINADVTAHAMRHAYVALLAHSTSPRIYTQTQLGHKRPTTADRIYNYVFGEEARARVGTEMMGVLDRAELELDGSRRQAVPRPRNEHPPAVPRKGIQTRSGLRAEYQIARS